MCKRILAILLSLAMLSACVTLSVGATEDVIPAVQQQFLSGYMPEEIIAELGISETELASLKQTIFTAAKAYESQCDISDYNIQYNTDSLKALSMLIQKEDPEAFHIDVRQVNFVITSSGQNATRYFSTVRFNSYAIPQEKYQSMLAQCETAVQKLMSDITETLTDLEKLLLLHDRLAVHCEYDYENYLNGTIPDDSYTIYGALVNRVAVCEGYAKTYTYMLDKLGIESYLCSSSTLNHMWNIVKLNGQYYHVDVTYDDPAYDVIGKVTHTYFLRSTEGMRAHGHNAYDYNDTPVDTTYDEYFWQNSQTAFQLLDGKLYYIDNTNATLNSWAAGESAKLVDLPEIWEAGEWHWTKNFARLSSDETYLYYSLNDRVMRYDVNTGVSSTAYEPDLSTIGDCAIFGFRAEDNTFFCDAYTDPNDNETRERFIYCYAGRIATSIEVLTLPNKVQYYVGEELDTLGLTIQVNYNVGTPDVRTAGFTVIGFDSTQTGDKTLTVTYNGLTAQFNVNVAERPPFVLGDVDDDGDIDSTDARIVLQHYVQAIGADSLNTDAADVNRSGSIDSTDARLILQFYVLAIDEFPNAA